MQALFKVLPEAIKDAICQLLKEVPHIIDTQTTGGAALKHE